MKTDNVKAMLIEKELVSGLTFPAQEVLQDRSAIERRISNLHRATGLGNLEKLKVRIRFEDIEGQKEIFTTIWAITQNKIILKGGRIIPIHRIHEVRLT